MSEVDDGSECPLCLEEIEIDDLRFFPCPCGYRVCRFCWNHIKSNLNNLCPACRREYRDSDVEYRAPTQQELQAYKLEKKRKERERKEMEGVSRRHLANLRVVRKNLVYVVGLSPYVCSEDLLKSHEYFGQFGKIVKVVVNKKSYGANQSERKENHSYGVYITYAKKEDAAKCIQTIEGTVFEGKMLRASYGTTKYCSFYLRGLQCQNGGCMYLHEPGEESESFSQEDMQLGKHHSKNNHNSSYLLTGADGVVSGQPAPFGSLAPAPEVHRTSLNEMSPVIPTAAPVTSVEDWPTPLAASAQTTQVQRASAWAPVKPTHSSNAVVVDRPEGIQCSLLDQIEHGTVGQSQQSEQINTSMLHRYMFLGQQAREYYTSMPDPSKFTFNPFEFKKGKSRFEFAKVN